MTCIVSLPIYINVRPVRPRSLRLATPAVALANGDPQGCHQLQLAGRKASVPRRPRVAWPTAYAAGCRNLQIDDAAGPEFPAPDFQSPECRSPAQRASETDARHHIAPATRSPARTRGIALDRRCPATAPVPSDL